MFEDGEPRKKSEHEKNLNNDIDMLSNLPDAILLLILSKLQTKDAVATSLLSSRYKSIWMNLNSLRFNNWFCRKSNNIDKTDFARFLKYEEQKRLDFAQFVNRVFILLKSKSIDKFCLKIDGLYPVYDITTWVTAAIARNLKVLKLDVSKPERRIVMPSCFYTCKTLEVLQICCNSGIQVPEFVCLPNLRLVGLRHVKFDSAQCVCRLLSGCPSLECLSIEREGFDFVTNFTIDSPTLKALNYSFHRDKFIIGEDFKLVLNTPKLEYLSLFDNASRDFIVDSLCTLDKAEIRVLSPKELNDPDSHYEKVVKLLQGIYQVNHLWIGGDTLEALSHIPAPQVYSRYSRRSVLFMEPNIELSLRELLDGSDKSHVLYLSKDPSDITQVVHWKEPVELPVCLLSCLKTISVCGFRGWESELNMIAYILKNAKVLTKMTIHILEADANFELLEKILKFVQGSERCEIRFS